MRSDAIVPSAMVRCLLPEIDERAWMFVLAIGVFAVLAMKEVVLPLPVTLAALVAGLAALFLIKELAPELFFYALIAYLPFSGLLAGHKEAPIPFVNLTNLLVVLILASHVLRQWRQHQAVFEPTPVNKVIWLFAALSAAALLRAGWVYGGWYAAAHAVSLIRWLRLMGFYFLALWVVRDERTLKTVLTLIVAAVTVVALMAIWEYLDRAGSTIERSRVQGIAGESNRMAAFFVAYMFLPLGYALISPLRRHGWVMGGPFLLAVRGVMVTFSRGAYIATGIGMLAACWLRHKLLFALALIAAVGLVTHPTLLPKGIQYRMAQTIRPGAASTTLDDPSTDVSQQLEPSASHRVEIYQGAVQMIKDHPWWGVGFDAFRLFIPQYTRGKVGAVDAHNLYLLIAAQMGLPTLLVFIVLAAMLVYQGAWLYRHSAEAMLRALGLGLFAGTIGLLTANAFTTCLDSSEEVVGYFWILSGLLVRAVLLEKTGMRLASTVRSPRSTRATAHGV